MSKEAKLSLLITFLICSIILFFCIYPAVGLIVFAASGLVFSFFILWVFVHASIEVAKGN